MWHENKQEDRIVKRNGKIELLRFLGVVFIMNAHFGYNADRPFLGGWYYVEFFFIITGFFTMRRFFHEEVVGGTERVRTALTYTFRKFVKFLPYTTVAILITYVANNWKYLQAGQPGNFLHSLENMPAEMLYLSAANPDGSEMFTIWFLSAMFLVFPLFCLLLMMKNKPLAGWICFATATFYYLHTYDYGSHVFPNQLVRAFAGLCLGACVSMLSEKLGELRLGRGWRMILSMVEVVTYLIPILTCYKHITFLRGNLICFIVSVAIIFSGQSLIPDMSCKLFSWLGKLSMPLYVWHIAVVSVIFAGFTGLSTTKQELIFWGGSFAAALVNMGILAWVHRKSSQNSEAVSEAPARK